jgi:hypothetical protein
MRPQNSATFHQGFVHNRLSGAIGQALNGVIRA